MKQKLTITVDAELLPLAKRYARSRGRGGVDRFHGIARARDCFTDGNQAVSVTLHGSFSHVRQTKPPGDNRLDCDFQLGDSP